mmetsp:Transcript_91553/g.144686  ORF Transcript_91553/g.144686 Transcript_91553/m.144686 type:complete len:192 (+) Transcript_91553:61-636(+)
MATIAAPSTSGYNVTASTVGQSVLLPAAVCSNQYIAPAAAPLIRAQTAPPSAQYAPFTQQAGFSLCYVGDLGRPFADVNVGVQSEPPNAVLLRRSITEPGPQITTTYSTAPSIQSSPLNSAAPTPINVECWQTVGQRLANIFDDPSLLMTPTATPSSRHGSVGTLRFLPVQTERRGSMTPVGGTASFEFMR